VTGGHSHRARKEAPLVTREPKSVTWSTHVYGTTALRREGVALLFVDSVYREERHIPKHEHARAFFNLVLEESKSCGTSQIPSQRFRGPA